MCNFQRDLPGRDEVFHPQQLRIGRNFSEPNYSPDWRHRQVQQYINLLNGTYSHSAYFFERLKKETDECVKTLLKFRQEGSCERQECYEWVCRTYSQNGRYGLGTLVKALTLARCSPEIIATLVGTKIENVEVFIALFWDVAPYLDVTAAVAYFLGYYRNRRDENIEADRDDLLLMAAWNYGPAGLALLLTPHIGVAEWERGIISAMHEDIVKMEQRHHERCSRAGVVLAVPHLTRLARKLENLLTSPNSGESRAEAFAEATLAIGRGAPLDEFL